MSRSWRLPALVSTLLLAAPAVASSQDTRVETDAGLVAGIMRDGVRVFRGIPFAAPPVGELRWRSPQPVQPWRSVRHAESYGPRCIQAGYPTSSVYARPASPTSEDCLYLNVWTTAEAADEARPVMVWIHGGAYTRGAGSGGTYEGSALARKGVVLVTINYRLGAFGYLAHPELTEESAHHSSGNYGGLDQIAALQWVQRNIERFGGDPSRVTIFGESAGSWSVSALVASPLASGLFQRAIGQSGGSFEPTLHLSSSNGASAERIGAALGEAAGAETLSDMRALSAAAVLDAFTREGLRFRSVVNVDGWFLPDEIHTLYEKGPHNNVSVIVGYNANEGTTLVPPEFIPATLAAYRERSASTYGDEADAFLAAYPAKSDAEVRDAYLGGLRDGIFGVHMRTWARLATRAGSPAYVYYFSRVPPGPGSERRGAYHAAEIAYAFDNVDNRSTATPTDRYLAGTMSDYWVNFATTGDPNGGGLPTWPKYGKADEPYLEFGDRVELRHGLFPEKLDFWEGRIRRP